MATPSRTRRPRRPAAEAVRVEVPDLDDPGDVLSYARNRRDARDHADAELFVAAAVWAEQHPAESIDDAAWMTPTYLERPLAIAGEDAPLVAEFAIPEFAAALGLSTDSGRNLIGKALEVKYRLPRLWRRVMAGEVPVWRARHIADQTMNLSREAAAHVDAQVSGFAHKIGYAAVERLVAEAVARFMPDQARADAEKAADARHVTFHHTKPTPDSAVGGMTFLHAQLDAADARDLDNALTHEAAVLKAAGCDKSLDVRRSMAAGELGRHHTRDQLTLDLLAAADARPQGHVPDTATVAARAARPKARQVVLHVHLSHAALSRPGCSCQGSRQARPTRDFPSDGGLHLARVEEGRRIVTADQVRSWCANPDTQVTVRPVIDVEDLVHVEAYEVPDRLQEQGLLLDHSCVFPWCNAPARTADCDHVVAHGDGGPTCSCNLAPLCRRHHRLKTHATWTSTSVSPGTYLWSSPHGYQFLRDHHGTRDVTADRPRVPPGPMHLPRQRTAPS
ncbi:MAG: endonuclease [Marmoricola sp.]|nr:endonuclease [Marmoricola sp.]